jgi:REP element-mobilizing transposase RayT
MGIVNDHLHVLLWLQSGIDLPRLVQGLKGASGRIGNRDGVTGENPLRWT